MDLPADELPAVADEFEAAAPIELHPSDMPIDKTTWASTAESLSRAKLADAAGAEPWRNADSVLLWDGLSIRVPGKQILKDCAGRLRQQRLTAVIGHSGSGKTMLLSLLAGRLQGGGSFRQTGKVYLHGREASATRLKRDVSYVLQDDVLLSTETPRDCLAFALSLRSARKLSASEVQEQVHHLLEQMALQECADVPVGSHLVKGISGGQRKRTAICVELITRPRIMLLDEPTSGLDTASAFEFTRLMHRLAETSQSEFSVMCTLHQPSAQMLECFQDIMIVHAGQVVYHGPPHELASLLASLSRPCPVRHNLAEHVSFTLDHGQNGDEFGLQIWDAWTNHQSYKELRQGLQSCAVDGPVGLRASFSSVSGLLVPKTRRCTSSLRQLRELSMREARGMQRSWDILGYRVASGVAVGVLGGCTFLRLMTFSDDPLSGPNCFAYNYDVMECAARFDTHLGVLLGVMLYATTSASQPVLYYFPDERPLFLREYASNAYGVVPYMFSKTLLEIPVVSIHMLTFLLCSYWLIGLHGDFASILATFVLGGLASSSLSVMLSCAIAVKERVGQVGVLVTTVQVLFSGILLTPSDISPWLRWLHHLLPLRHAVDLLIQVEFRYLKREMHECEAATTAGQPSSKCSVSNATSDDTAGVLAYMNCISSACEDARFASAPEIDCAVLREDCERDLSTLNAAYPAGFTVKAVCPMSCGTCSSPQKTGPQITCAKSLPGHYLRMDLLAGHGVDMNDAGLSIGVLWGIFVLGRIIGAFFLWLNGRRLL